MIMDETLYSVSERVKNFAIIWLVDISEVPDFNKVRRSKLCSVQASLLTDAQMYELYDECTVMFFYRNKHIMIDLGTGCASDRQCFSRWLTESAQEQQ
jgi:U5 snRNP protein, DIM1 family